MPATAVHSFPSQQEIRNGQVFTQDVKVSLRPTREEALGDFLDVVKERMEKEPLLVFIANDDPTAVNFLAAMMEPYKGSIFFAKVENMRQAQQVQKQAVRHDKGVVFLKSSSMGREVDFRFTKDAYVMILNYDLKYRSSNVT